MQYYAEVEYPQVPAHLDTFEIQMVEWLHSLRTCEYFRDSSRRFTAMRKAWKSGLLAKIRIWLHTLGEEAHYDFHTWMTALNTISLFVDRDLYSPPDRSQHEDALRLLEQRLQDKLPEEWARAEVLYQEWKDETKRGEQKVLRGFVRLAILFREARLRANDRLYQPGGKGYYACKERFEAMQQEQQQESGRSELDSNGVKDEEGASSKQRKRPCDEHQDARCVKQRVL
jgi:hypothetical protein